MKWAKFCETATNFFCDTRWLSWVTGQLYYPSSIPKWAPVRPNRGPTGAQLGPTGAQPGPTWNAAWVHVTVILQGDKSFLHCDKSLHFVTSPLQCDKSFYIYVTSPYTVCQAHTAHATTCVKFLYSLNRL